MNLKWNDCKGDQWCPFLDVDLNHSHFNDMEGVYIIWYWDNDKPVTVRIGQGIIKDRLSEHRKDPEILEYEDKDMYVTWARIGMSEQDAVEKYLADTLEPLVGESFPDVYPREVNLPW